MGLYKLRDNKEKFAKHISKHRTWLFFTCPGNVIALQWSVQLIFIFMLQLITSTVHRQGRTKSQSSSWLRSVLVVAHCRNSIYTTSNQPFINCQCDGLHHILCPRRVFFRDLVTGVRPTGLLVNECNVILIFIATISLPHFTWIDYNTSDSSRLDPTLCNLPSFNI